MMSAPAEPYRPTTRAMIAGYAIMGATLVSLLVLVFGVLG